MIDGRDAADASRTLTDSALLPPLCLSPEPLDRRANSLGQSDRKANDENDTYSLHIQPSQITSAMETRVVCGLDKLVWIDSVGT